MKNKFLGFISVLLVFSTIIYLCACGKKSSTPYGVTATHRARTTQSQVADSPSQTQSVVAKAPKNDDAALDYFNESLRVFRNGHYDFTRTKNSALTSYSAGSLSTVSNATQGYQSSLRTALGDMMGVTNSKSIYYDGDDITYAFAVSELKKDDISSIQYEAVDKSVKIIITLRRPAEDADTALSKLTSDYMKTGDFTSKISNYAATSQGASVSLSNIALSCEIDYATKNFNNLTISYDSTFYAEKITLAYVSGGPVKGVTNTKIIYNEFKVK